LVLEPTPAEVAAFAGEFAGQSGGLGRSAAALVRQSAGASPASGLFTPVQGGGGDPGLAFASAWEAATGTGSTAVGDGGQWTIASSTSLSVVTTASLGGTWPSGLDNVLRVNYNTTNFSAVYKLHGWPQPAVGEYLFRRLGIRVNIDSASGDTTHHPIQSMGDAGTTCAYAFQYFPNHLATGWHCVVSDRNPSNPGFSPTYVWQLGTSAGSPIVLALGTYYQIEERFLSVTATTWKRAVRILDAAGSVLYQSEGGGATNFYDTFGSAGRLDTVMAGASVINSGTHGGQTCVRCINIGNQGRDYGADQPIYFGGFAVKTAASADAWIGGYQAGEAAA
jgi:hypothetical protein